MQIVQICEALEITYETYMNAPKWWIELRMGKLAQDQRHQSSKAKK